MEDVDTSATADEGKTLARRAARAAKKAEAAEAGAEAATVVTKRVLFDRVQTATGANKKSVREIVDATLDVLGHSLRAGEALNVPPFGRMTVKRSAKEGSTAITVRIREGRTGGRKKAQEGVAEPAEAE
ncbi:MAG: HU family DNA-binding protein [Gemmobacter sp.]